MRRYCQPGWCLKPCLVFHPKWDENPNWIPVELRFWFQNHKPAIVDMIVIMWNRFFFGLITVWSRVTPQNTSLFFTEALCHMFSALFKDSWCSEWIQHGSLRTSATFVTSNMRPWMGSNPAVGDSVTPYQTCGLDSPQKVKLATWLLVATHWSFFTCLKNMAHV
jgi:hypothetical protein